MKQFSLLTSLASLVAFAGACDSADDRDAAITTRLGAAQIDVFTDDDGEITVEAARDDRIDLVTWIVAAGAFDDGAADSLPGADLAAATDPSTAVCGGLGDGMYICCAQGNACSVECSVCDADACIEFSVDTGNCQTA